MMDQFESGLLNHPQQVPTAEQQEAGAPTKLGVSSMHLPRGLLNELYQKNQIHVTPTGNMFVKAEARQGILPQMLDEILKTRVMVKQSMKKNKDNVALSRLLNSRQVMISLVYPFVLVLVTPVIDFSCRWDSNCWPMLRTATHQQITRVECHVWTLQTVSCSKAGKL